jgi:hypothetical protein
MTAKNTSAKKAATKSRGRPPAKAPTVSTLSPSKQLDGFIDKFEPDIAKLARACRASMRRKLPTANELVYDNYQFLAIGYSATERASDTLLSIAVGPSSVSLCFYYGAHLPDPQKILHGGGNQVRFYRVASPKALDAPALLSMIRAADVHGRVSLPRGGKGQLIIKAISAKQRPRRPKARPA